MRFFDSPKSSIFAERTHLPPDSVIFGWSPAMQSVRHQVERIKGSNVPVLIQGESGTGKEVVATFLHHHSPWGEGPLVKISCPSIPSTLMETELFGYEKGAFTGADGSKPGRVEMAHRGTLFLDEIGELDLGLQAKLLQFLQDGQFSRIGARQDTRVELRVVCATNRRLDKEIQAGAFRRDLFYRINVVAMQLPPLRERREDIPGLVEYFLETQSAAFRCKVSWPSARLMQRFETYAWPGNIRQLENLIKRYVLLGNEEAVSVDLVDEPGNPLDPEISNKGPISLKKLTEQAVLELERRVILKALQANRWNRKDAARVLNISYRSLLSKMRQAGLPSRNGHSRAERRGGAGEIQS